MRPTEDSLVRRLSMAKRPTPHQYRMVSYVVIALCVTLRAIGCVDDVVVGAVCTAAMTLAR